MRQNGRDAPSDLYDHQETGLKTVFPQAKAAVSSQFQRCGTDYGQVAAIRY
jgi:hypothetical protein